MAIARMRNKINLTQKDALDFLNFGKSKWPQKTFIYLDPPYYVKGHELYYNFYKPEDHAKVAKFVTSGKLAQMWMVSYDNVIQIRDLYAGSQHVIYNITYSARTARTGSEVMFFANNAKVPPELGLGKLKK